MSKHILFVCKSCNPVHSDDFDYEKSEGATLLNQLQVLHLNGSHQNEVEIKSVGCLWTCSQPCAVAFSAPGKATYLFTNIPVTSASALLTFGTLYHDSKNGDIPWKQFPEVLQSANVAKIPAV